MLNDSLFYLKVESEDIGTLTKIWMGHDNSALVLRGFQTRLVLFLLSLVSF